MRVFSTLVLPSNWNKSYMRVDESLGACGYINGGKPARVPELARFAELISSRVYMTFEACWLTKTNH